MRIKTLSYAFLSCIVFAQSILLGANTKFVYAEDVLETTSSVTQIEESRLVISAVQITGGTGKTHQDFIELYNPSSEPFDLNGHRIVKRTAVGVSDVVIKSWDTETLVLANHFYLWANSNFSEIEVNPDATSSATLADNNGIALRFGVNDSGEVLDSAAWGSTANGFDNISLQNPSANESLVRETLSGDQSSFTIKQSTPRNSGIFFDPEDPQPEEPVEAEPDPEDEEVLDEIDDLANIRITEILPNPTGVDSGFEKVELYNQGNITANLKGYKLDDIASNQPLSTNAYVFPDFEIAAKSYKTVTLPSGSMSLNNAGGDILTLFGPNDELIYTMYYEDSAPEGKSYSYFPSGWKWTNATFGKDNGQPPKEDSDEKDEKNNKEDEEVVDEIDFDNTGLEITEIFPQPDSTGTEFIEIYNSGSKSAQLAKVTLYVGERKKLLPEYALLPGKYFAIEQGSLPIQLRNSGQTIKIQEETSVLSIVTYPAALENSSFAKFEDGFLWTTKVTKASDNILEIPEEIIKTTTETAAKTAVKKAATTKTTTSTTAKTATTANPSSNKPTTTNTADQMLQPTAQENMFVEAQKKQKESLGKIIAMGATAVTAGVFALYKFVFTAGME